MKTKYYVGRCSLIVTVLFLGALESKGIEVFYDYDGEKIIKVADFPRTDEFKSQEGEHVDAGYMYKQFRIFWVPAWNYDGRWCGYISDQRYVSISKEKLNEVASHAGIALPNEPTLPAWDLFGGKLTIVGGAVCLGLAYLARASNKAQVAPQRPRLSPRPAIVERQAEEFPVQSRLQAKLVKAPQAELKCACMNCGQHLSFEHAMLGRTIECPACHKDTLLESE